MATGKDDDDLQTCVQGLRKLVLGMPDFSKGIIRYLFAFLYEVASFSKDNKMTASNLAIVFAPNILRSIDGRNSTDIQAILSRSKDEEQVVAKLISHFPALFEEEKLKVMEISKSAATHREGLVQTKSMKGWPASTNKISAIEEEDVVLQLSDLETSYAGAMTSSLHQQHLEIQEMWRHLGHSARYNGGVTPKGFSQVAGHIRVMADAQQALLVSSTELLQTLRSISDSLSSQPNPDTSETTDTTNTTTTTSTLTGFLAVVKFAFVGTREDELHVQQGDALTVVDSTDTKGWWTARKVDGTLGLIPYNYVRRLDL